MTARIVAPVAQHRVSGGLGRRLQCGNNWVDYYSGTRLSGYLIHQSELRSVFYDLFKVSNKPRYRRFQSQHILY